MCERVWCVCLCVCTLFNGGARWSGRASSEIWIMRANIYSARSIQCAILHTARCVGCVSTTPVIIRWYKWHKQKAYSYQKRHTHFSSESETHHTTPHRTTPHRTLCKVHNTEQELTQYSPNHIPRLCSAKKVKLHQFFSLFILLFPSCCHSLPSWTNHSLFR